MRIGSLFDGSGTAPLAATLLGWEAVWASEIEQYPISVTNARFPNMLHLGSITEINGARAEPVDVIVGGSPCQDLSVAGKQAGLEAGTRSNLFYEMTRVIREMRSATNGQYPRFVVWENVPGAFSSNKGRDFLAVVEAFCAVADIGVHIPRPAEDKTGRLTWKNAGTVVGDGWSFAWRVLDAQFWGVPQRRRRIFAVLDLGSECAGEILFERTRLPWDSEPRGETGEGTPADAVGRADRGGRVVGAFCAGAAPAAGSIGYSEQVAPTLKSAQCAFPMGVVVYPVGAVGSLCARADSSPCIDRGQPFIAYESGQGYWMPGFGCLRAEGENRPSRPSHCVIALQGNGIDRSLTAGCNGETVPTLTGDHQNRVTDYTSLVAYGVDCRNGALNEDLSPTMQAKSSGGQSLNCMPPVLMESAQANAAITEGVSPCLNASHEQPIVFLPNRPPRRYIVRRLTPTECARLQGFPDWWTDGVQGSDSAKYKMWGNGMALPCVLAVMNGITEMDEGEDE